MTKQRTPTNIEVARRHAVLAAIYKIIRHELGNHWTLEAHMARKAALLEIIDNNNNNEGK